MGARSESGRHDLEALARECSKLDPAEENAMAEEGMTTAPADWALYNGGHNIRPQASLVIRTLGWLRIGAMMLTAFGFVFFFFLNLPLRLLQPPTLWPLFLAFAGLGLLVLASVVRDLARWFGRKSGH